MSERELAALEARVVACRRCPRLVAWRERVARVLEPGARFAIATLHPLRTADEVGGYLESRRYDVPIERDGLTLTFSSMHHSIEGYITMLHLVARKP